MFVCMYVFVPCEWKSGKKGERRGLHNEPGCRASGSCVTHDSGEKIFFCCSYFWSEIVVVVVVFIVLKDREISCSSHHFSIIVL